jgi:iron(III) transport system permease protein
MLRWRLGLALVLLTLAGLPALLPFVELLTRPQGWQAWNEPGRILALGGNTLRLLAGTLLLAVPAGVAAAILLYRTDLPLRRVFRFVILLTLFVPLPLFASAWQAALGTGGWLPVAFWNRALPGDPDVSPAGTFWRPWALGLGTAIWVQAVAALPWVIVLAGQGFCWVERELEEEALLAASPGRVIWKVTLPRARAALWAAALWVALMALTDITVTDTMQVRTFAEEVYTQVVAGDRLEMTRAVAVSLPAVVLAWAVVLAVTRRWQQTLPPLETINRAPRLFSLGRARWPCCLGICLAGAVLLGVPLASLLWKMGLAGSPPGWSAAAAWSHWSGAFRARGGMVVQSVLLAAGSGVVAAVLALLACWLALGSRVFAAAIVSLMALIWAMPGPILGFGLKETIERLLDLPHPNAAAVALYYGPSPLPAIWAQVVRFFPAAVALIWPTVRLLPQELRDAARVEGLSPVQELRCVVLPLALPASIWAGFAVMVLSLGELSAGKLVATPGSRTFAQEVFDQMHYGVTNDLAALCLVLLLVVLAGGCVVAALGKRFPARKAWSWLATGE